MKRWKIAQWLENIWWKRYLKDKNPENYLNWKKDYWRNLLLKIDFPLESINSPCIDIGCGPAGIFTILEDKNTTAIDPLLTEYEKNLAVFSRKNYPNIHFETTDFEAYETNQKFNTIFCLNAINHFHDIELSFKKLNSLLHKNGTLILSIDAHNFSFFKYLFRYIPLDALHPHQYNLNEYKSLLENAGFKIERAIRTEQHFFFDYWVLVARRRRKNERMIE